MADIKGTRTKQVITLNPKKANPGEELYIDIPKLNPSSCLVPGSIYLLFDFKNKNTKSWFLNNLGKLLFERLVIKLAGETVYDNSGESFIGVYADLWLSQVDRTKMVDLGIANENLRKTISGDDTAAGNASDTLMYGIYGTKQRIGVNKILEDHGLLAPFKMNNNLRYTISLPKAEDIMVAQGGEVVAGYTLENIELEYETIENLDIANKIAESYTIGWSLSYTHATLMSLYIVRRPGQLCK